jgi:hypothetical protein
VLGCNPKLLSDIDLASAAENQLCLAFQGAKWHCRVWGD